MPRHVLPLTCALLFGLSAAAGAQMRDHAPADFSLTPAAADSAAAAASAPASAPTSAEAQGGSTPTSPLAIHVGDADLLIGGFMDLTSVTRSTNPGTGIGTSFGTIPFSNAVNGGIGETKFSAQNSRLTLQATSKYKGASVKGYLESDFLGNAPNGLNVTSNSNTLRMRIFWVQFTSGKFEFLGGQSWSMATPGRTGISPMPGDIFFSQDVDTNYQMGLPWGRTPGFRFIAHANKAVTLGLALENPEQYVGGAVTLPAAFPGAEVDSGSVTQAVPNAYPDIIGKVALDPMTGKTHQHLEASVVVRGYKTHDPTASADFTKTGTAFSVNGVLEANKNVHLIGTAFISNGSGRYIANTNIPDFIVNPDFSLTLVKSRSFIGGAELNVAPNTLIYGYYSYVQADQRVTTDKNGKAIGFGVAGSTAANHKIESPTVGLTQTFFKDAKIGGMQLMVQFSRVQRTPFSVPAGTPTDAKVNMLFVNVRYVLP